MAKIKKYTDDDFAIAVKTSISISQTLKKLNLKPSGGNYVVAKRRIISFLHIMKGKHKRFIHVKMGICRNCR